MEEQTIWKQMYLCLAGAMADAVDLMEPVPECRPAQPGAAGSRRTLSFRR